MPRDRRGPRRRWRWCAVIALCAAALRPAWAAERPDIVVVLADDLGYADVGFLGGKDIKTPHLDRLAASGAVLRQFYAQPACTPTRAALLTGRYPMRYGLQVGVILPTARYGLPLEERTLAQALREAGYTTAAIGKWHLGSFDRAYWPTARGFDHHYGHLTGAIDYFTRTRFGALDWYRDGAVVIEDGYATHLLAREAVRVIGAQPQGKPLFLYLAFNAPHAPHQVPQSYTRPYAGLAEPRRTYAGMVAAMDESVGRVLDALDRAGRRKNAIVIFSSDNGGPDPGRVTDNGPLRAGKGTLYEGGVRVCALVAWPGRVTAGRVLDEPMHVVDWYPTLLAAAGASPAQTLPVDGRDLQQTIVHGQPSPRRDILLNAAPDGGAIRRGDWKLLLDGERAELFNLRDDPSERTNLAQAKPENVRDLRSRYERLAGQAVPPKWAR
jgi:arylsulfatase A-like enzyme